MNVSSTAKATLLLTGHFSRAGTGDVKPLTNAEWGRFALWLKEKHRAPEDLLCADPRPLLNGWRDNRIGIERILRLLDRGHSLALALEKWQRAALWVITRSDPAYPQRLKARLKTASPPVLFGCGNRSLLNMDRVLAVVGSRNAEQADLKFAEELGGQAAAQGYAVVSGCARGVDEAAMLGAVHAGGHVIGVVADSLLKASTSMKWRDGLMDGGVVLVSPFRPEAGFNAGNAMARNKYIYCLAEASLVVHSGKKGGTLNGARENLKEQWAPLWVKPTKDPDAANATLVRQGGRWCAEDARTLDIRSLSAPDRITAEQQDERQPDLFSRIDGQEAQLSNRVLEPDCVTYQRRKAVSPEHKDDC